MSEVCAVVPSSGAVHALGGQSRPPDDIVVRDGTAAERLGAALQRGTDWIWLVENDVEPAPAALEELLAPLTLGDELPAPALVSSKVVGGDGRLDRGSAPWPVNRGEVLIGACRHRLLAVRVARWGSLLVRRDAVLAHGLPPEDAGPRGGDLEWTGRILATAHGYLAPRSVVTRSVSAEGPSYAETRAHVRMLSSEALAGGERLRLAFRILDDAARDLSSGSRGRTLGVLALGSVAGLADWSRRGGRRDGFDPVAQAAQDHRDALPSEAGPA